MSKYPKLYIKEIEDGIIEKPKTVKDFLQFYFLGKCKNINYSITKATYFDKECTKLHCNNGKTRSFDDMLFITKTYYNLVTPKKLIHYFLSVILQKDNDNYYTAFLSCSTIQLITVSFTNYKGKSDCCTREGLKYQYLKGVSTYNSEYSWIELLAMLDIKDQKSLDEYINKYMHKQI